MLKFKQYINEQHAKGGFDYEDQVNHHLQKHGAQKKGAKSAGASADAADGSIHTNGKSHNLEVKKDSHAGMGQLELNHTDEKGWHVSDKSRSKGPALTKHVESSGGILSHVKKHWKKPSGDYKTDLKTMGNIYHKHDDTSPIRDHYHKDRKTSLMQIGGSGLHHTGSSKGTGAPKLNGTTKFRARVKDRRSSKQKAAGKQNYGFTVTMQLHDHKPSHIDLDNPKHVKAHVKAHGVAD